MRFQKILNPSFTYWNLSCLSHWEVRNPHPLYKLGPSWTSPFNLQFLWVKILKFTLLTISLKSKIKCQRYTLNNEFLLSYYIFDKISKLNLYSTRTFLENYTNRTLLAYEQSHSSLNLYLIITISVTSANYEMFPWNYSNYFYFTFMSRYLIYHAANLIHFLSVLFFPKYLHSKKIVTFLPWNTTAVFIG